MTREISPSYRHETTEINSGIDGQTIVAGWLELASTDPRQIIPETTHPIESMAEKFLPMPDTLALNTIDQITEGVHATTEIIDGIGTGDIESTAKSTADLIKPALKSGNEAETQISNEQQIILDEIEKIFAGE